MTITYHHTKSPFDQIDTLAYNLAYGVFSGFKRVTRLPVLVAWVIGLVLLITFGLVYTVIFYLPLLWVRKRLKNQVATLIRKVPTLETREAMLLHADVESSRIWLEKSARIGAGFFVFVPLVHEIKKSANTLHKLEVALFLKTYPDHHAPLTTDQAKELMAATENWRADWEDETMNVYND